MLADTESAQRIKLGSSRAWLRQWSFNDWFVLGYLLVLNLAAWAAEPSAERTRSIQAMGLLLLGFVVLALVIARGQLWQHAVIVPFAYRVAHFAAILGSYLLFADFLPAVNPGDFDTQLYQLDLLLFGFEPAVAMDRFVSPFTTEWFSFFYYGYFFLLGWHIFPILFLSRRPPLLHHFATGMIITTCVGHTLYMLVPGFGPTSAFPELFRHPLPDGLWWNLVSDLVSARGAQKDIFPSLHTALPTFVFLFSYHHRNTLPFKYTWPLVGFFVVNIIIATMFLRWHYVIDVVAGLILAAAAHVAADRIGRWELPERRSRGLSPVWPSYFSS